ncbi:MAG TPA: glycosyltransferase family 1 protein, partial [Vicinamibacteria bacterium]|nr:glycosyltransferase family 1 protein [Vicinamibacteria bacterium]
DVKLLIIGDEINRYAALRRSVEAAGVRQDVRFFGFVPVRTLAALYRLASVFAFPSLYEGFGLPPLEAMACGTPVVTSRISSLPEVVGDAAVLVDPYSVDDIADGLERVLGDEALRADLIARGRERVAQFSWDRSVRAIHAHYMKVLGRPVPAVVAEEAR